MNCEQALSTLELLVGGTVAAEEVDVTPQLVVELEAHAEACPVCARARDDLSATARQLALALAPSAGDAERDRALVRRLAGGARAAHPRPRWRFRVLAGVTGAAAAVALFSLTSGPEAAYPLAPPLVAGYAGPAFRNVAASAGISQIDHTGRDGRKDWMVEVVGHGAAVLDMDGDGDLDLFVPDGNRVDPADRVEATWRLYRNDGDLKFTDVTDGSGLSRNDFATGAVAGDLDADGRPDLVVTCFGENRIFANRGGGRFEDVTVKSGAGGLEEEWSTAAALGDVDGDGDLDLYVANYADMREFMRTEGRGRTCRWRSLDAVACGPQPLPPQLDRLFLNRGDGTFTDATAERLPVRRRYSFQPVIVDLNGDGALDIFVASDNHPNQLLVNDGTGRFEDVAMAAGVSADAEGNEQACMGVAVGDHDGDGRVDLFITNFSHEPCVVYRALSVRGGTPVYSDVTRPALLREPSMNTLGWGASFLDHDLDGDLDVVAANGHLYPDVRFLDEGTTYAQHIALFRNEGGGRYVEVSSSAGGDLVRPRVHRGLLVADFDDDGEAEVFVTVLNGEPVLLTGDGRGTGRRLVLDLRRRGGRIEAAGARVTARIGEGESERVLVRDVLLGSSFASGEDPRIVLGLGADEVARDVEVRWPFGEVERFGNLAAGRRYRLVEGSQRAEDAGALR